jgi:hypothetical protein
MEKENFFCKIRIPEIGEKWLLLSSTSDENDLMFPAELIGLRKQEGGCAMVLFNGVEYSTNVPFEIALSRLFREEVVQTKRGM